LKSIKAAAVSTGWLPASMRMSRVKISPIVAVLDEGDMAMVTVDV
jgi:hypothetical protein